MDALLTGPSSRQMDLNPPPALLCGNLTPPSWQAALLTHRESKLSSRVSASAAHCTEQRVEVLSLCGNHVAMGFLSSVRRQNYENWCWEREVA